VPLVVLSLHGVLVPQIVVVLRGVGDLARLGPHLGGRALGVARLLVRPVLLHQQGDPGGCWICNILHLHCLLLHYSYYN
jgi:hypothetical protein